jgi:hypothetical protein
MPRHPAPCSKQHRVAERAMDVKRCAVVDYEIGIPYKYIEIVVCSSQYV